MPLGPAAVAVDRDAGADKVSVNSAAVREPELISRVAAAWGAQAIVLAIDAKRRPEGGWEVFTHGGRRPTLRGPDHPGRTRALRKDPAG